MSRRRTDAEIARALRSDWTLWVAERFAQFGVCPRCKTKAFVAGKRRNALRCEKCHLGRHG